MPIYIGGGRASSGNIDVFDGTIYSVQFYEEAMSVTDVAAIEGNKLEGTVSKETKTMDAYILSAWSDGSTLILRN